MVRGDGEGWRCVDCGQWFENWPPDSEPCPGSPPNSAPTDLPTRYLQIDALVAAAFAVCERWDEDEVDEDEMSNLVARLRQVIQVVSAAS
jgi:hypothetical protein